MLPQFYRSALLLGSDGINTLAQKRVAVFGVGGVGSFAVEALVRCGIYNILLVDNDTIDITNINRQLPATLSSVGRLKTHVLKERIIDINPDCNVETKEEFVLKDNLSDVLTGHFDYIIDAIDTVSAKLALAEHCHRYNIPLISSMGTGNKLNPTMLIVADIYDTSICPLCRVMRSELKKRGIPSLKVVYSTESPLKPDYAQLPNKEQEKIIATNNSGRALPPGSVSFVPPVAGMILASEVIKDLLNISS